MAIKRVFSAGGIILKRDSGKIKVLVTQHSKHHGWDFPKGHLEIGESSETAALREVEEETGVKGKILGKAGQTQYFYYDSGQRCFKTVNFFFMKYLGEGKATTAFEVSDQKWLPVDEVEKHLTFDDTKKMWRNARSKIERLKPSDTSTLLSVN